MLEVVRQSWGRGAGLTLGTGRSGSSPASSMFKVSDVGTSPTLASCSSLVSKRLYLLHWVLELQLSRWREGWGGVELGQTTRGQVSRARHC